jgi:hypothetical protein
MNIGFLAFGFAGVCGLVSLIGAAFQNEPPRRSADYQKIYEGLNPKEI